MIYESKVLKIVPKELQPSDDIKCRGCIHGNWRLSRVKNIQAAKSEQELDVYCKNYFEVKYHSTEPMPEILECDGFSDEVKEED